MLYTYHTPSPIGTLEIVSDGTFICRLTPASTAENNAELSQMPHVIKQCVAELDEYFSGKLENFTVPVFQKGTNFQQKVWSELIKIPYASTISYAQLAERAGHPKACRAAGSANGKNDIIIIVPCHRVINSDGKLGGYAYGLEMKHILLNLEKSPHPTL